MFAVFIVSLLVCPWISLFLHETGHALAGRIMKKQILEVRVGVGPAILRTRMFEADILVGLLPLAGRVKTFPQLRYSKAAKVVFIAAGPVTDLVLLSIMIALFRASSDMEAVRVALFPAIAFQVILTFGNLMPRSTTFYGQRIPNDTLAFWQTVWSKDDPFAANRQLYLLMLQACTGIATSPLPFTGRSDRIAYYLLEANRAAGDLTDQQIAKLDHELSMTPSLDEQLLIMDSIVTHLLAGESPGREAYLDELSERALSLAPHLLTLQRSRGSVLARLGRHEEALILLADVEEGTVVDRCWNAAFRALAHFHAGRKDRAKGEFEIAIAILQSQNWGGWIGNRIIDRVRAEIGDTARGLLKMEDG
jgi:hypothetical protein